MITPMTINFRLIKQHLQSDNLAEVLSDQLQQLDMSFWQLIKDARHSGIFDESRLQITILDTHLEKNWLEVKIGLYVSEAMTPCPCAGEDIDYTELYCERTIKLDTLHHTYHLADDNG